MSTTATTTTSDATQTTTLQIGGMTCASCVTRIEKSLNRLEGVTDARVDLATEVASVTYRPTSSRSTSSPRPSTKAGYTATPRRASDASTRIRRPRWARTPRRADERDRELARMKRKWQVALATGLGPDGPDVRAALHRHDGLADAGHLRRRHRRAVLGRQQHLRLGVGRREAPHAPT